MPIHDWTRVASGTFHDFHQGWTIGIRDTLNAGVLPPGYFAMADQRVAGPEPDVVALQLRPPANQPPTPIGGTTLAEPPTRLRQSASASIAASVYARKANRIVVRHRHGRVVAVIEILSPGNKNTADALAAFVHKIVEFLNNGIHVLLVDLFPPSDRDPDGIHQLIWSRLTTEPFEARPEGLPLTVASYDAGEPLTAHVEPLAVGDALPDAPLFLQPGFCVSVPLEATYQRSWAVFPQVLQQLVESGEEEGE